MTEFLQLLVAGVTTGALFALVGMSFVLIYRVTRVVNFSQGDFVAAGALTTVGLVMVEGHSYVSVVPAVALIGAAIGIALCFGVILPLASRQAKRETHTGDEFIPITGTLAFSLIVGNVALWVAGPNLRVVDPVLKGPPWRIGDVALDRQQVITAVTAAVLSGALWLFLHKTTIGLAMRAIGSRPSAARAVGVRPSSVIAIALAVSGAISAIAGLVIAPLTTVHPGMALTLTTSGFAAAVIGGFGSPFGAMWGGMIVGVGSALYTGYIDARTGDLAVFAAMLFILMVRPTGLMAEYQAK